MESQGRRMEVQRDAEVGAIRESLFYNVLKHLDLVTLITETAY
jgi:hypothetical protein